MRRLAVGLHDVAGPLREWAGEELLEEVPRRQVVFTIPKRLRITFRYDRQLLGELAGYAWRRPVDCVRSQAAR